MRAAWIFADWPGVVGVVLLVVALAVWRRRWPVAAGAAAGVAAQRSCTEPLVELVLGGQALRRLDQPRVDQALAHLVLVDVLEPDQQERG